MEELNPKLNSQKKTDIEELWYRLSGGEKFGKVNLVTNAEFEEAKPAGTKEYVETVKSKTIPLVWGQTIEVVGDRNIHAVFLHGFNLFDQTNPQKGVEDKTSFKAVRQALNDKNPNDFTISFIDGRIIGTEFNINQLANASIQDKKIYFWGLQKRIDKFIDYLIYIAESGVNEIIIMDGRDEHIAKQKLNRNVLQDAILDKFNALVLKYAVEKAKSRVKCNSTKRVRISYVPGVRKVFNICKTVGKNKYYYDISNHTNLKTNSSTTAGNRKAAEKQHGEFAQADHIFVATNNVAGSYDNITCTSSLARFKDTSKGFVPTESAKGYNSFTILLGESHELEVIRSTVFTNTKTHGLEMKKALEDAKFDYMCENFEKQLQQIRSDYYDSNVDYKGQHRKMASKDIEKQGE